MNSMTQLEIGSQTAKAIIAKDKALNDIEQEILDNCVRLTELNQDHRFGDMVRTLNHIRTLADRARKIQNGEILV